MTPSRLAVVQLAIAVVQLGLTVAQLAIAVAALVQLPLREFLSLEQKTWQL